MNLRTSPARGFAVAIVTLPLFSFGAAARLAVSSGKRMAAYRSLINGHSATLSTEAVWKR